MLLNYLFLAEEEGGEEEDDDDDDDDEDESEFDSDDGNQVYGSGGVGLEEMLKDNIDEESEGNDYVLDEEEGIDQDTTDESDEDIGEGDDTTANGIYLFNFLIYTNMSYPIFV